MALLGSQPRSTIQVAGQYEPLNEQAHILIAGRDAALLSTRASVLRTAGYRVSTTLEPVSGQTSLFAGLFVVCHTLSESERADDLACFATASPQAKALCLVPNAGGAGAQVPTLDSFCGAREMLRVVNRLLSA